MHNPLAAVSKYRELLLALTWRHVKVRYKQSFLGIGWAIVQPVSTMVLFTVVFSKFLNVPSNGIPYPIFVYSAILPWTFFSKSLSQATNSFVGNVNLVTKIYFPREIIIYSIILVNGLDFVIAAVICGVMMFFYDVAVNSTLLLLPVLVLIQLVLTASVSMLAASINVKYRDIGYILPFGMQLLMYACPIIYPVTAVPAAYRSWYMINPMAGLIDSYRRILTEGMLPNFGYLGMAAAATAVICVFSYLYFKKAEMSFADII